MDIIETQEYKNFRNITKYFIHDDRYYDLYFSNDFPVPFELETNLFDINQNEQNLQQKTQDINQEKPTIYLYPIKVYEHEIFNSLSSVLTLDEEKMQGKDFTTIKMTYLDFLYYKANKKNESGNYDNAGIIYNLFLIMSMVLHCDVDKIQIIFIEDYLYLLVDKFLISTKSFEEIRLIICNQNNIELPDIKMHPSLKKILREAKEFETRHCKNKACSFTDLKSRITGRTGIDSNKLNYMTIREFYKILESTQLIVDYDILTLLSPNMEKKDINKIKHWLADVEKVNELKKYSVDANEYANSLSGNSTNANND